MARVNVRYEEWLEFRLLAMTQKRSVADYLGELVRCEIDERKRHERTTERPSGSKEDPAASRPSRSRVRLAEANLLMSLPVGDASGLRHR